MRNYGSENLSRLSDRIYSRVKRDILTGKLKPGEHLPLEATAESLGVSTTPVRDAFGLLAADGLVDWRPRRGAYVAELSAQAIADAYQVRECIECCALEYALRDGAPVLAEMQELVARIAAVPAGNERTNAHARAQLEQRFHGLPIECAGNGKLWEIHASLNSIITIGSVLCPLTQERIAETAAEHQAIVDALHRGDLEGAQAAMRTHLRNACTHLLQYLAAAQEA